MRNPLSDKVVQMKPSGIRKFFDLVQEMPDAISLGVGEPDFDTPWHIREEGIYSLEKGRTFYTSNAGLLELRKAIAHYMYRKYELTYKPAHEIVVTVGGSEGIDAESGRRSYFARASFRLLSPMCEVSGRCACNN